MSKISTLLTAELLLQVLFIFPFPQNSANFGAAIVFIAIKFILVNMDTLRATLYIPTSLSVLSMPSIIVSVHPMIKARELDKSMGIETFSNWE